MDQDGERIWAWLKGFGRGQAGQGYGELENDPTTVLLGQGLTAFMGSWAQGRLDGGPEGGALQVSPPSTVCLHTLQNSEDTCCGPFDCCELGFFRPHRGREWTDSSKKDTTWKTWYGGTVTPHPLFWQGDDKRKGVKHPDGLQRPDKDRNEDHSIAYD